jgi:hypothetical protein
MTNSIPGGLGHRAGSAHGGDPGHGLAAGLRPERIQHDRSRHAAEPRRGRTTSSRARSSRSGWSPRRSTKGIVSTNDVFDCENGMWSYAGRPLRDFHPYGELDVTGILRKSSNIGTAKIALMLGDPRLHRYLTAFGMGQPTGIEVPGEEAGMLAPPSRWTKVASRASPWGTRGGGDGAADAQRDVLHRQRRISDAAAHRPEGGGQATGWCWRRRARGHGAAHHGAHRRADAPDAAEVTRRAARARRRRCRATRWPARPARPRRSWRALRPQRKRLLLHRAAAGRAARRSASSWCWTIRSRSARAADGRAGVCARSPAHGALSRHASRGREELVYYQRILIGAMLRNSPSRGQTAGGRAARA